MLFESEHIETIGCNVMGGTREGHQPEEGQRTLQPVWCGDGKCHSAEGCTNEQLHGDDPPTFGLDDVDKWTP